MSGFLISVYDLKDFQEPKRLIDEFSINEAESNSMAADIAHKKVEDCVLNNIKPYDTVSFSRLLIETRNIVG